MLSHYKYLFLFSIFIICAGTVKVFALPWSTDMWWQPSFQPYEEPVLYPPLSINTQGNRVKPLIPREEFEPITKNPAPPTAESIDNGEKLFTTYCVVCHGLQGKGDGPIIKKGFYPVDLSSPGVQSRTDGYIYSYIRFGGKVMMPSYRESITSQQAWDIVNYVRKLQGKLNTIEEKE